VWGVCGGGALDGWRGVIRVGWMGLWGDWMTRVGGMRNAGFWQSQGFAAPFVANPPTVSSTSPRNLNRTPHHNHNRTRAQQEAEALKHVSVDDWAAQVIYATWPVAEGPSGLRTALETVCAQAEAAVDAGAAFLVLSDRNFGPDRCAVPPLLVVGAVHHRLVDAKKRSRVGLVVETAEVRLGLGWGWVGSVVGAI